MASKSTCDAWLAAAGARTVFANFSSTEPFCVSNYSAMASKVVFIEQWRYTLPLSILFAC
eukprot:268093-Karenia_brevis.AAC.1